LVDIALTLGFSSQTSFTLAFGQATGVAPGQLAMPRLNSETLLAGE